MKTINLEIQVPDWVEWIAMDADGYWSGYSDEPMADLGCWTLDEGSERTLLIYVKPTIQDSNIYWRESLRKV